MGVRSPGRWRIRGGTAIVLGLLLPGLLGAGTPRPSDLRAAIPAGRDPGIADLPAAADAITSGGSPLGPTERPGTADDTGAWITSGIDVVEDGMITTRSHSAGARSDRVRANERVLGPNWRFEPLGGVLGTRLYDHSAAGYVAIQSSLATTPSQRFQSVTGTREMFVSGDGGIVVRRPDGSFQQTDGRTGLEFVWRRVGTEFLITAVGTRRTGMVTVTYDVDGRVSGLVSPVVAGQSCVVAGPSCSAVTFRYAKRTTATVTRLGTVAGQLMDIVYDAAGDAAPTVVVTYRYDAAGRLREVSRDQRSATRGRSRTTTYQYDLVGNIIRLVDPLWGGVWTLVYSAPGRLRRSVALPFQRGRCEHMWQYMYGKCWFGPVSMGYGGKKYPALWKTTPGGARVVGVDYDHCSNASDKPLGFDFRVACDAHDFGYGIIYTDRHDRWTKIYKFDVDAIFFSILRDRTCNAYRPMARIICRVQAVQYYLAVSYFGGQAM